MSQAHQQGSLVLVAFDDQVVKALGDFSGGKFSTLLLYKLYAVPIDTLQVGEVLAAPFAQVTLPELALCKTAREVEQCFSILDSTQRLRNRAGVTRRVLLVLTDGADQFSVGSNRAAIAAAEAKGVEIVGIGMLYDASGTFSRYVQVDQMRTIATQGLGALLDVLDPNRKPARKAA